MTEAEKALRGRLIAVLNTGSGGCDETSEARIQRLFEQAELAKAETVVVGPDALDQALTDAVAGADVVIVLGGDGTIRAAAEKCGAAGKLLIPLPGGTMNMLPHALYGDVGWEIALEKTLAQPCVRDVSGGSANGHPFYCAVVVGAPSLWADAREAVREGDFAEAVKRSVTAIRRHAETVGYRLDDESSGRAEAVAVICPLISSALEDDERWLEAVALDHATAVSMFRLAFLAIFSDWRSDPSVTLARVKSLKISSRSRVPAILDGEKTQLGRSVEITFRPLAFRAIAPQTLRC